MQQPFAPIMDECKALPRVTVVATGELVKQGSQLTVPATTMDEGEAIDTAIAIRNAVNLNVAAALRIESVSMGPADGKTSDGFQCLLADKVSPCIVATWPKVVPKGAPAAANQTEEVLIVLRFRKPDLASHAATVKISFRGVDVTQKQLSFTIVADRGKPKLALMPPNGLSFPNVGTFATASQNFTIANAGDAPLTVKGLQLQALPPQFSVRALAPQLKGKLDSKGGETWLFETPLQLGMGGAAQFELTFSPTDYKAKTGTIFWLSNDLYAPTLAVSGNTAAPCVTMQPFGIVDMGGAIPGGQNGKIAVQISSCGSVPVVVTHIDFAPDPKMSAEFSLDLSEMATKLAAPGPLGDLNPLVLKPTDTANFGVTYAPNDITDEGAADDFSTVALTTNALSAPKLTVKGHGAKVSCPIAKAGVAEGDQVIPQTLLHLLSKGSFAAKGLIAKYEWSVKQPSGSKQILKPGSSFANPTFAANVSGEYEFCLNVWDTDGLKSCAPACTKVLVLPINALHIELVWDTPGDPDQTDTGPLVGCDLDLHFAHPLAAMADQDCDGKPDPWFSLPWDTFFANPNPNWGLPTSKDDDPSLDLDDSDGAGPENFNLISPEGTAEQPAQYSVGVHFVPGCDFGPTTAYLNLYLFGVLSVQLKSPPMLPADLWFAGHANWPNLTTGGSVKPPFETCLQTGQSCAAQKNLMWQPAGQLCVTPCYKGVVKGVAMGGCGK